MAPPPGRCRMGACETTPPTAQPGDTNDPNPANPAENLFLASDDRLQLAGVQLVRPRHCAAPGAPAGPRTTRQPERRQLSGRGTKQSAQPGNRTQATGPEPHAP